MFIGGQYYKAIFVIMKDAMRNNYLKYRHSEFMRRFLYLKNRLMKVNHPILSK
ncbi:hypothetical protein ABID42_004569 [Arcicella rosea]